MKSQVVTPGIKKGIALFEISPLFKMKRSCFFYMSICTWTVCLKSHLIILLLLMNIFVEILTKTAENDCLNEIRIVRISLLPRT
jgi:hypothetical protein